MYSFNFKNKDSYLDYGIIINERPPTVRAERNVQEIEVPGRDGDLTIDEGTYKPVTFPFVCTVLDTADLDSIIAWLDGFGDLILSWQPDRAYKAKMINRIDIKLSLETLGEFPLIFKAQPFGYALTNDPITLLASPATINNGATKDSRPIVKVYGTGTIDLTINIKVIHLTNVVEYVTIDSVLEDAHKDTLLKNGDMSGEFPTLQVGSNTVSWTGTVTKVEIIPNWRWL